MFKDESITKALKEEEIKNEIIGMIKDSISDWFINETEGILETVNYDFFCESLRDKICNYFKVWKD